MVFNATFNNISVMSWQSVLLVKEIGVQCTCIKKNDLPQVTDKLYHINPANGEVHSIQHYVIKFVCDLRQVGGFQCTPVSSKNKTDLHDITEI